MSSHLPRVRHGSTLRLCGPLLGLGTLPVALILACQGSTANPCGGVDCSSRGFCVVQQEAALCECIPGFHPVGLACVPNNTADPCTGVDCSAHGECAVVGGAPTCVCAPGYHHPDDYVLHCVEDAPCDGAGTDCGAVHDADVDAPRDDGTNDADTTDTGADDAVDTFVGFVECTGTCQQASALVCEPGWTLIKEWHSVGCARTCTCSPSEGGECTASCECSVLPAAGGVWCVEVATESLYYEPPDAGSYYWNRRDQYVTASGSPLGNQVECQGAWCSGCEADFSCVACCR